MRAGKLRHRLRIRLDASTAQDSFGHPVEQARTVATVWGEIVTLSGLELIRAQQVAAETTHQVRIRHYEGLTRKHWFEFNDERFDINFIDNTDQRNIENICLCKKVSE